MHMHLWFDAIQFQPSISANTRKARVPFLAETCLIFFGGSSQNAWGAFQLRTTTLSLRQTWTRLCQTPSQRNHSWSSTGWNPNSVLVKTPKPRITTVGSVLKDCKVVLVFVSLGVNRSCLYFWYPWKLAIKCYVSICLNQETMLSEASSDKNCEIHLCRTTQSWPCPASVGYCFRLGGAYAGKLNASIGEVLRLWESRLHNSK